MSELEVGTTERVSVDNEAMLEQGSTAAAEQSSSITLNSSATVS